MAPRLLWIAVLTLSAAGTAVAARPQSLADLARQEAERRKAIKDGGKVITNADLPRSPAPAPGPDTATKPAPAADAKAATPPTPTADVKAESAKEASPREPVKGQAYWAGRLRVLKEQLDRDQLLADAMQSRINALTTDFVNRDDPAQRAVIFTHRQRALAELDRLKKSIVDGKKALTDFEEEARRAGVPPGWLR